MAAEAEAYALAAVSQAPEPFRRMLLAMFGGRPGITNAGDWLVAQRAAGINMSVDVAAGTGLVLGSESASQGGYFCQSTSITNVLITAANVTNPRRDLIVARIRDNQYATGPSSAFSIEVKTGTAAASPVDPTVDPNCLVLARVAVAANATTIANAVITDLRTTTTGQSRAAGLGGVVVCSSTARPTVNLYEGLYAYETDTDRPIVYNGSAWITAPSVTSAQVITNQSTSSTSYTDLATPGPAVTVLTGTKAYVEIGAQVGPSVDCLVSVAVSGATTVAVDADKCVLYALSPFSGTTTAMGEFSGLNPGLNTFTMKYSVSSGTCTFLRRRIAVRSAF